MNDDQPAKQIKVFYDGQCPMCSTLIGKVRSSTKQDAFVLCDMHKQVSLPFSRNALEKDIHVIDRDGQVYRGAQGILKIAAQYPRLRVLTAIAQFPIVRPLLPVGYNIVAANRRFLVGAAARIFWLKVAIVLALCIGLIMSPHLWIGPRSYPIAPVLNFLPSSIYPIDPALFAALFALAIAAIISARPQKFIFLLLGGIGVFCILDQTRWQPWLYQYCFLLASLALFSWDSSDKAGRDRALNIARLVVATTYIFSGLQKLNFNFVNSDFPWIAEPITDIAPWMRTPLHIFGAATPFIEMFFGLGLLTKTFRRASLILAVSMHVFVLAMFGPLGHDWNNIIWPWTAAMAIFDIVLFTGPQEFSVREIFKTEHFSYLLLALVLFALLPVFSFVNLWDSYLSSALYSGNLTEATIYVSDQARDSLPEDIKSYLVHTSTNTNVLNLQRWAIEDLNVTPYPESRVYKSIFKTVCAQTRDTQGMVLILREQRMFFSHPETGYRCWDL